MADSDRANNNSVDLPENISETSAESCAMLLRRALARSPSLATQADLASTTGIDRRTLGKYFTGKNKPRPENWSLLRAALQSQEPRRQSRSRRKGTKAGQPEREGRRIKALAFLLQDALEYFRTSSPEAREALRDLLPGPEAGRLAALLVALYDEDQLAAFEAFAEKPGIGR